MTTLLLPAVGSTWWKTGLSNNNQRPHTCSWKDSDVAYVALATNHLLAVVLAGQGFQGRLDNAATQTQDQVEC